MNARRTLICAVAVAVAVQLGCQALPAQDSSQTPAPPQFADAWMGGPLDRLYMAEMDRLQAACSGQPEACWAEGLDTTAVDIAPVWSSPEADEPVGQLQALLRPRGRYPYAALVFTGTDGRVVSLLDDVGDWGYGTTLALAETRDGWIRPWLLDPAGPYWLSPESTPGFGIVDGPYGLEGRLWRLEAVEAISPSGDAVTLPAGVYFVLEVTDLVVRLRAEYPPDMPCSEEDERSTDPAPPVHEVQLARLFDASGRPSVQIAYPKGC